MKKLSEADLKFRALVASLDGHQPSVAEVMGITKQAVACRLRSEKHSQWWVDFKTKRSARRRRARDARSYVNRKKREQLWKAAYPFEDRALRAALEDL